MDPAVFKSFCCLSNATLCRTSEGQTQLLLWLYTNTIVFESNYLHLKQSLFHCISDSDIELVIHSAGQLPSRNAKLQSCNVTHSELSIGLQLRRVPGLKLLDWTWTGQPGSLRRRLQWRDSESALRSPRDSSWCSSGSHNYVCHNRLIRPLASLQVLAR